MLEGGEGASGAQATVEVVKEEPGADTIIQVSQSSRKSETSCNEEDQSDESADEGKLACLIHPEVVCRIEGGGGLEVGEGDCARHGDAPRQPAGDAAAAPAQQPRHRQQSRPQTQWRRRRPKKVRHTFFKFVFISL